MKIILKSKHVLLTFTACAVFASLPAFASSWLIQDVRVFDGEQILTHRNILIRDGKIIDTNFKAKAAANTKFISGAGRTLIPGLIDAHVHAYQEMDLSLLFGVTTQIDMFTAVETMQAATAKLRSGGNHNPADIFSAGTLATAPGGHGTEYGIPIDTLTKPEQAQAWVDARIAEGSYFIKIVMESGSKAHAINSLDIATVKALIKAAHLRNKLAVVHISTAKDAQAALEAGADGLVHLFVGKTIADTDLKNLVSMAKKNRAFIIPTFSVMESMAGIKAKDLIDDQLMASLLSKTQLQTLNAPYGATPTPELLQAPLLTTAAMHAAHVPLLAGTDAGNRGTQYGASLHHEMAALVQAGLSPKAALVAATSAPARAFKLNDRGRIAKGYKADLVLVEGEPDIDITATRRILEIWKDGEVISGLRQQKMQLVEQQIQQNQQKKITSVLPADGRISLFNAEKLASPFGFGWVPSNDARMGGKSVTEIKLAANEPAGQAAISIHASVKEGFAFPWSGVAFFPGKIPMEAVDLSAANTLRFKVKGDGKNYSASITLQGSYIPISVKFNAPEEWKEISIPFSQFKGMDASIVTILAFNAGPEIGEYQFQIADVRLLKE